MKKKSIKVWVILLVLPYILLVTTAIFQMGARFVLTGNTVDCGIESTGTSSSLVLNEVSSPTEPAPICRSNSSDSILITLINIFSLLVGVAAVIGIIGTPLWIIMLVQATRHNNQLVASPPPPPPVPQS